MTVIVLKEFKIKDSKDNIQINLDYSAGDTLVKFMISESPVYLSKKMILELNKLFVEVLKDIDYEESNG
jgi:hypothetical protein